MSIGTFVGIGDSQTDTLAIYGVRASDMWVSLVGKLLGADTARSFGVSGNTSQQLLDRADVAVMYDRPDVVATAIGVNDAGAAISTAQTRINISSILMALKHGAMGPGAGMGGPVYVAGQANLPASGKLGQRYVVRSDTSTTGGVAARDESQATTVTGSVTADDGGNKVTVWEFRYPLAGEYGWGRVAIRTTAPTFVAQQVIVPPPYRNWTTGGDTLSTPETTNAALRTVLAATVAAENVSVGGAPSIIYSDLYAFMKSRIQAGTDPDFSAVSYDQARSWHYIQNNQHYAAYGHALQAQKVAADIAAAWPALVA